MGAYGLFFLVAVAIGGVAWVFLYPYLSGEKKAAAARGERRARRADRAADARGGENPARTGRRHAEGDRATAKKGQPAAALGPADGRRVWSGRSGGS